MSSAGLSGGPESRSSSDQQHTPSRRDQTPSQPAQNPTMASMDAFAIVVADARRAIREFHEETEALGLISSQLHTHLVLLQLVQTALNLNSEQNIRDPAVLTSQDSHVTLQPQTSSVNALEHSPLPLIASVRSYVKASHDNQRIHCLICLDDYVNGCPILVLPCHHSHNFHVTCLAVSPYLLFQLTVLPHPSHGHH